MQVDKIEGFGYYINIMNEKCLFSTHIIKLNESVDMKNGCVIAVGGFDGMHLGHRALVSSLMEEACRLSLPAAVFTFDPQDSPKTDAKLLAQPEKKLELLKELGVSAVFSASFSKLKAVTASDFALKFLFEGCGAKSIVCGYDFRFGANREGDVELIKALLFPKGVSVVTPSVFLKNNEPVSATVIRGLIADGNLRKANELLGRAFSFKSEVVHGRQLGRKLGFNTINQNYPSFLVLPKFGVYAVECLLDGKKYNGIANFGIKPTVGGIEAPICETNIFDYNGDCYGSEVEISFVEFIREEMRFPSVDALSEQIQRDKARVKEIFSKGELNI